MPNIIFKGNALSTNNIYRFHQYTMYMTKAGSAIKERYQWDAKSQWKKEIMYGRIEMYAKLYFGDKRKRDIDNYNKLLLDSMSGIVYIDDKQIEKLTVEKLYDKENPRIEVEIKRYGKSK